MYTFKKQHIYYLPLIFLIILCITNIDIVFSINTDQITDRSNYQNNITDGEMLFTDAKESQFPFILFSEPLFKFVYYLFNILQIDSQIAVKIILFVMLSVTFYLLIKKTSITPFWIILIVLSPTVLVNYIMTIRQGFATVLFLSTLFLFSSRIKYILMLFIPLFHFSFFIVLPIYFLSFIKKKFNLYIYLLLFILSSALFSILILKLLSLLNLSYFEGYEDESKFNFGFGLIFWSVILILFILEGKDFLLNNLFETLCICFYVASVSFFNPFSRILQAVSIILLVAGFRLSGRRKQLFKSLLFLYVMYLIIPIMINYNLGTMMLN